MKNCLYCNKQYKNEKCLQKHMIICQTNGRTNDTEIIPTPREMYVIIQKLLKQNKTLGKKIEKLEKIINKDIKKINVLDWLNDNDKGIDINIWLKNSVNVKLDDLYLIFQTDYSRGLSNILSNNINLCENTPFRCFSHKIKQLYIYENDKWKKTSKCDFIKIFDRLSLNILKRSKDYDNSLNKNEKFGSDNLQYLKNCDKIMIVDTKQRERYYKFIESTIISLVKQNLSDLEKFKFYM
mgnify:CR=1 FL=1|jgi:hypothetical protein